MALGSFSELAYCFHLARDLEYLKAEDWQLFDATRNEAGRLTWKLYDSLTKAIKNQTAN